MQWRMDTNHCVTHRPSIVIHCAKRSSGVPVIFFFLIVAMVFISVWILRTVPAFLRTARRVENAESDFVARDAEVIDTNYFRKKRKLFFYNDFIFFHALYECPETGRRYGLDTITLYDPPFGRSVARRLVRDIHRGDVIRIYCDPKRPENASVLAPADHGMKMPMLTTAVRLVVGGVVIPIMGYQFIWPLLSTGVN